jgi:hypothetical protein
MEKTILPENDETVSLINAEILECLDNLAFFEIAESAEDSLPLIELDGRRFKLNIVELI